MRSALTDLISFPCAWLNQVRRSKRAGQGSERFDGIVIDGMTIQLPPVLLWLIIGMTLWDGMGNCGGELPSHWQGICRGKDPHFPHVSIRSAVPTSQPASQSAGAIQPVAGDGGLTSHPAPPLPVKASLGALIERVCANASGEERATWMQDDWQECERDGRQLWLRQSQWL